MMNEVDHTSLIIGEIFSRLAQRGMLILEEQMIDFARLLGILQRRRIPECLYVSQQANSFARIFKAMQSQMTLDNNTKKEISPELSTLSFKITELETSVTTRLRITDQKRAEFEKLEKTPYSS